MEGARIIGALYFEPLTKEQIIAELNDESELEVGFELSYFWDLGMVERDARTRKYYLTQKARQQYEFI